MTSLRIGTLILVKPEGSDAPQRKKRLSRLGIGRRTQDPPRWSFPAIAMTPAPFRENLRGILTLVACNLLFLINDTFIKLASEGMPLGEIILIRACFAVAILIPIVWRTGGFTATPLLAHPAVFWRTVVEILAAATFLLALLHIPIANVNAIIQIVPLLIAAAGAMFLGEQVGWRRWTAIGIGFVGVLIVVRPGLEGFTVYSLVAFASAIFVTVRDITTRIMPRGLPALLVALVTAAAVGLSGIGLGIVLGEQWVVPSGRSLGLIAVAVVFLIGGYVTAVEFMRYGDISVVAPFRYTVILFAIAIGYLVWGEVPDAFMLVGTAIIAATGVYTFHRERNLSRLREEAAAGEGL
jgi:drug/metabolite transporter (DMT)-like permease